MNAPQLDRIRCRFLIFFICSGFAFSQKQNDLPNDFSFSSYESMTPLQKMELEKQARERGYSRQQIDSLKKQHLSGTTNDTSAAPKGVRSFTYSEFSDSVVSDTLAADTTDEDAEPITDTAYPPPARIEPDVNKYFGYSLFKRIPDAFKPNELGPVDPGYLVGPGDVLRLSVWGEVEFQYELQVNKEGNIFIPVAGQVYVTGIPFEQLQQKIQKLLSRHYSGLATRPQKSFLDLSVARLRPIRIFIMGEVASPGGYTVSSSSTAFNALYSAGGPLLSGSLRNISVLRNSKEITSIDIYDYLTAGKCSTDVRLQNDDVIFIPPRGSTVSIKGPVFRPSIYELKDDEHFQALLTYCGGVRPETNINTASIHRTVPFDQRSPDRPSVEAIDFKLSHYLDTENDFQLCDRDTIFIKPLYQDLRNHVLLEGAVQYPGIYQSDSLTLYSLIFDIGKPIGGKAFTKRGDLRRLNADSITYSTQPIDLQRLRKEPAYDRPLKPFDEIFIYEAEVEKPTQLSITVDGEVRSPGTYSMSSNLTVIDALLLAGGLTRAAYRQSIDIYRLDTEDPELFTQVFSMDLPDSLNFIDIYPDNFQLQDQDRIVVRPNPDYVMDNYITITGLVRFQGKYALKTRGERLSDMIKLAGGLLPNAFLEGATITREGTRLIVNFKEALYGKKDRENIVLQKNDSIHIPLQPRTVLVHGNVNNPGLFSYIKDLKAREYIERAGGLADSTAFILVTAPNGETAHLRRRSFKNPVLKEGSEIFVKRKPPKTREEDRGPSISEVVRDTLAIMASAVTIIGLAIQLNK